MDIVRVVETDMFSSVYAAIMFGLHVVGVAAS